MTTIKFNSGIDNPELISKKSIDILQMAGSDSNNSVITITSGIRSSIRQATAMYNNLSKGNRIRYASPGMEVIRIYDENNGKSKDIVINMMSDKIEQLQKENRIVSKHCVSIEDYCKNNIIDISKSLINPRDIAVSLMKWDCVKKIITPFSSSNYKKYLGNRIFLDINEPAIHIEIYQL